MPAPGGLEQARLRHTVLFGATRSAALHRKHRRCCATRRVCGFVCTCRRRAHARPLTTSVTPTGVCRRPCVPQLARVRHRGAAARYSHLAPQAVRRAPARFVVVPASALAHGSLAVLARCCPAEPRLLPPPRWPHRCVMYNVRRAYAALTRVPRAGCVLAQRRRRQQRRQQRRGHQQQTEAPDGQPARNRVRAAARRRRRRDAQRARGRLWSRRSLALATSRAGPA